MFGKIEWFSYDSLGAEIVKAVGSPPLCLDRDHYAKFYGSDPVLFNRAVLNWLKKLGWVEGNVERAA